MVLELVQYSWHTGKGQRWLKRVYSLLQPVIDHLCSSMILLPRLCCIGQFGCSLVSVVGDLCQPGLERRYSGYHSLPLGGLVSLIGQLLGNGLDG